MRKLLRDKFKVKEKLAPIEMQCYEPARPKGMHKKTYNRLLRELYILQESYYRQFVWEAGRICGMI